MGEERARSGVPQLVGWGTFELVIGTGVVTTALTIRPLGTPGWIQLRQWLHFTPQTWMSASVLSFLVAGAFAALLVRGGRAVAQSTHD